MSGILYLLSILVANLIVNHFGIVTILGVTFPAGAPLIGMTFTFRDMVQRQYGKYRCWWWMIGASLITLLFNWQLALASMCSFLVAEGVDWLIYTNVPGSFTKRVILSNLFGLPLDSIVFVVLAFGWNLPAVLGQTLIKLIFGSAVLLIKR